MIRSLIALTAAALLMLGATLPASAVTPDEMLKDANLEARARDVSKLLRCVVCQNQSIDDSNAPLAQDLRILVRERITAGDTNEQTINFIVARYGNFVLLKPPMQLNTLLLWFGPALLFALASFGLYRTLKAQAQPADKAATAPLSADEQKRLGKILGDTPAKK
jgi:cytochrome c-type biogenesis protein CcmH